MQLCHKSIAVVVAAALLCPPSLAKPPAIMANVSSPICTRLASISRDPSRMLPGNNRLVSMIGLFPKLIKEAEFAARDPRIQAEMNSLLEGEILGPRIGFGRFHLGNSYYELRGSHGARLFIKRVRNSFGGEDIIIVGKATKKGSANESEVFNAMRSYFEDFPAPKGSTTDTKQR